MSAAPVAVRRRVFAGIPIGRANAQALEIALFTERNYENAAARDRQRQGRNQRLS